MKLNIVFKIVLILLISIGVLLISFLFFLYLTIGYGQPNLMAEQDLKYYNFINKARKNNSKKEIELSSVFNFEWDKIYIPKKHLFPDQIKENLNLDCQFSTFEKNVYLNTVIFIKENNCVYELYYDYRYIEFFPHEEIITRDNSKFSITKKWNKIILSQN